MACSLWPCNPTPGEGTRPTSPAKPPSCRPVPSPGVPFSSIMRIAAGLALSSASPHNELTERRGRFDAATVAKSNDAIRRAFDLARTQFRSPVGWPRRIILHSSFFILPSPSSPFPAGAACPLKGSFCPRSSLRACVICTQMNRRGNIMLPGGSDGAARKMRRIVPSTCPL